MGTTGYPWLGRSFPPVDAPTDVYRLVEVGPLSLDTATYAVLANLRIAPYAVAQGLTIPTGIVDCPVSINHAGALVPGALWSVQGHVLTDGTAVHAHHRCCVLGGRPPQIAQWQALVPQAIDLPASLQGLAGDAWYAIVDQPYERLVIPCFELARAFCYHAGESILEYCFSRLALDRHCWPVATPSPDTNFSAHLCLALMQVSKPAVRLWAELCFNPAFCYTVQEAHATLALAWHAQAARARPTAWLRMAFDLGRDVHIQAQGTPFLLDGRPHFWVSQLAPDPGWFCFDSVTYHPVVAKPPSQRPVCGAPASCSLDELLPIEQPLLRTHTPPRKRAPAVATSLVGLPQAPPVSIGRPHTGPPVFCAQPWACIAPTHPNRLSLTNETVLPYLWETVASAANRPYPARPLPEQFPELWRVMMRLQEADYQVQALEVHNPDQCLGAGCSAFPYTQAASWLTHLPDRRLRPIAVAVLSWSTDTCYLVRITDEHPVLLVFPPLAHTCTIADAHEMLAHLPACELDWRPPGWVRQEHVDHTWALRICPERAVDAIVAWCHRSLLHVTRLPHPDALAAAARAASRHAMARLRAADLASRSATPLPAQPAELLPTAAPGATEQHAAPHE